jgi:CMP-N-acetylneuraminic acid synthetase
MRSQDLPEAYHDAAQFYWMHVPRFLKNQVLYGVDAAPIVLPRWRVQDTDTFDDWRRAEHVYQLIMKEIEEQSRNSE